MIEGDLINYGIKPNPPKLILCSWNSCPHEIHPLIFIKKTGLRFLPWKLYVSFWFTSHFLVSPPWGYSSKSPTIMNSRKMSDWIDYINLVNLVKYVNYGYIQENKTLWQPMFDPSSLPLPGQWSHCRGPTTPEGDEDGQRYLQWPRGGTGLEMWISTIQNGGLSPPKSGTCSNKFGV